MEERENRAREYAVHVLAVNSTDLPSAVVTADLNIVYEVDEHLSTVKIQSTDVPELAEGIDTVELPKRLDANDALSGWLVFRVPDALVPGRAVQRYDVVVRDVHDAIATVQIAVFREMN